MNQTPEMDEKKTSSPETAPIAATAEHNANFEENIRAIIRSGKPASVIRDDLDNYHANDIAEVLETLDTATRKRLYNILSLEMTAEIFTYLDEPAPYPHELGLDRPMNGRTQKRGYRRRSEPHAQCARGLSCTGFVQ